MKLRELLNVTDEMVVIYISVSSDERETTALCIVNSGCRKPSELSEWILASSVKSVDISDSFSGETCLKVTIQPA